MQSLSTPTQVPRSQRNRPDYIHPKSGKAMNDKVFQYRQDNPHQQQMKESNNGLTDRSATAQSAFQTPRQEAQRHLNPEQAQDFCYQPHRSQPKSGSFARGLSATSSQRKMGNQELNKDLHRPEHDAFRESKQAFLYNSNPLNAIQEHWELESKASGMHGSQSQSQLKTLDQRKPKNLSNNRSAALNSSKSSSKYQNNDLSGNNSSLQKSRQEEKKERVEQMKGRIKQLFLNYCDFSIESGKTYLTYTHFLKVIKDAKIIDNSKVTQNQISIVLNKECNVTNNIIKAIGFEQFLNCILRISELKYPEVYARHPKQALQSVLKNFILPLLDKIETTVEYQGKEQANSLYSVSEMTLRLIVYNEDTQVIFKDILPVIKQIYQMYFEIEVNSLKGNQQDLQKAALRSIMNFLRDFELSPYLVHPKVCYMIWYSIIQASDISDLCNNNSINYIVPQSQNQGKCFTLGHFVIFLYRLSVVYFNHTQADPVSFNLVKKLLYFLRKMENSEGFKLFMSKLHRTYNDALTFLPCKDLLIQILKAEGIENQLSLAAEDYSYITREAMVSRILEPQTVNNLSLADQTPDQLQMYEEAEAYIQSSDEGLKRLFEIFCSFGEPMNTKYLKASKLSKMLKDCGLLKGQSKVPSAVAKGVHQVHQVDIDLVFKQQCFREQQQTFLDQQKSTMSMGNSHDYSHQASIMFAYSSQMSSKLGGRLPISPSKNQSSMNKTLSFGHQSHLLDNNGHQGRLDFSLFKKVLEVLSPKVMIDYPPTLALAEVLKRFLLPLLERVNDKRCVHNKNIQKMLLQLDNQEMITLLTTLHKSIINVYKSYSDGKGHMNFTQFIGFCSDFNIFPAVATKATLYRIFHSLSYINDVYTGNTTRNPNKSQQVSMFSFFTGTSSEKPQLRNEIIDEHLFVEALAIVGLSDYQTDDVDKEEESSEKSYQDEDEPFARADFEEDVSELSPVEKVLQLVERIANSDGLYGRQKQIQGGGQFIKCSLMDKKDLLEPFRQKYRQYFKNRYHIEPKKNFDDVLEMSSVWSDASRME